MKLLLLSLCLALASAKPGRDYKHSWGANGTVPKSFINLGAINIQGVGSMNVISQSPGNIDKLDNGFRLHGGGQAYFTQGGGDMGGDPYVYWQTELYNKVFSYDIDVSAVGCKCNAAMYWVNMPGYDGSGNPDPAEWGIYYCDANFVNGNWCPEYDTFEGNSATMNVAIDKVGITVVDSPLCRIWVTTSIIARHVDPVHSSIAFTANSTDINVIGEDLVVKLCLPVDIGVTSHITTSLSEVSLTSTMQTESVVQFVNISRALTDHIHASNTLNINGSQINK